jgi:hypothetical protein
MQVIRNQPILVTRLPLRDEHGVIIGAIGVMLHDRLQRLQPMFLHILKSRAGPTEVHHEIAQRRARYTLSNIAGSGDTLAEVRLRLHEFHRQYWWHHFSDLDGRFISVFQIIHPCDPFYSRVTLTCAFLFLVLYRVNADSAVVESYVAHRLIPATARRLTWMSS